LSDIKIMLAEGWSPLSCLAVTLITVLSVLFFYRRIQGTVPSRRLVELVALRCVAMGALLLCLFRPVLSYQQKLLEKSTLICLVDTSRSMSVRDYPNLPDRLGRVKDAVLKSPDFLQRLNENFDLAWFAFSDSITPLNDVKELADLKPEGEATNIVRALKIAMATRPKEELAGIVLFSDGVDTSAGARAKKILSQSVPIYAVGVGSRLREQANFKDIKVAGIEANRTMPVKNANEVRVLVDAIGYPDRKVKVILKEGDKEVARESLVLDNRDGNQIVKLKYTPRQTGQFTLTASIPVDPAERNSENNFATFPVVVIEARIRVLYLEGTLRTEYKFLRRALEFDPNIETLCLVETAGNLFLQQGSIKDIRFNRLPEKAEEFEKFDVIIFGDIERARFKDQALENIKNHVKEGAGFLMIGGYKTFGPGGYTGSPIEEILPVQCGGRDMGQEKKPFYLKLTAEGENHPIFAGCKEFFMTESGGTGSKLLPRLRGCVRVGALKPGATLLAVDPEAKIDGKPLTVLAVQQYGAGRTAAFTADTTWQWQMFMKALGQKTPYYKFWGQLIRWLAGREETERKEKPGVFAFTDKSLYQPGEKVQITAFVRDSEGQATKLAQVTAKIIRKKETSEIRLNPNPDRVGEYTGEYESWGPGNYKLKVVATLENKPLGEATVKFQVGQPNLEFDRLDIDESFLRKLSVSTGGRYFPLVTLYELTDYLDERIQEKRLRKEIKLWQTPFLFCAFILLITGEWILRKTQRLS